MKKIRFCTSDKFSLIWSYIEQTKVCSMSDKLKKVNQMNLCKSLSIFAKKLHRRFTNMPSLNQKGYHFENKMIKIGNYIFFETSKIYVLFFVLFVW